ncbi:hypothetical protein ZWY2020_050276 [Hordeum vulgare]|nr:hypothetical protein ZWY2020_050276 [Hordeum vulgare]
MAAPLPLLHRRRRAPAAPPRLPCVSEKQHVHHACPAPAEPRAAAAPPGMTRLGSAPPCSTSGDATTESSNSTACGGRGGFVGVGVRRVVLLGMDVQPPSAASHPSLFGIIHIADARP